jgi:hypothetical protein
MLCQTILPNKKVGKSSIAALTLRLFLSAFGKCDGMIAGTHNGAATTAPAKTQNADIPAEYD